MCGGTQFKCENCSTDWGLSPRVRGNRQHAGPRPLAHGSIPACAGEPILGKTTSRFHRVYPRVCGGTLIAAPREHQQPGLSPRVRGNLGKLDQAFCTFRSIPACAGEPAPSDSSAIVPVVYPRVCGGTADWYCDPAAMEGLSPRVRGNRYLVHAGLISERSIPACAGEPNGMACELFSQ